MSRQQQKRTGVKARCEHVDAADMRQKLKARLQRSPGEAAKPLRNFVHGSFYRGLDRKGGA